MVELQSLVGDRIKASPAQIAEFCQRWNIAELALFGSVLRDDFRPDRDIDVLVTWPAIPPVHTTDRLASGVIGSWQTNWWSNRLWSAFHPGMWDDYWQQPT